MTKPKKEEKVEASLIHNAWMVILGETNHLQGFTVAMQYNLGQRSNVCEGDAFLIIQQESDGFKLVSIARVYRTRSTMMEMLYYFDGLIQIEPAVNLNELGISADTMATTFSRCDWSLFEKALQKLTGLDYASFPRIKGKRPWEQAYIRELLQLAVMDDLLGPADGPEEEIIGMSVRDRYLVGKLAPLEDNEGLEGVILADEEDTPSDALKPFAGHHHPGEEFASTEGREDSEGDEDSSEVDASKNKSKVPSSFGFTFCVTGKVKDIELQAYWGRYERITSERINEKTGKPFRAWKRIPSGGKINFTLQSGPIKPFAIDPSSPEVLIQGSISSPMETGDLMVTLFLVNTQRKLQQNQDQAWIFQPELIVRDPRGEAIFQRRPFVESDSNDTELKSLQMIYRKRVEFAVGHGISVSATTTDEDTDHATEIRTCVLPEHEVPITETPGFEPEDRPAMRKLIEDGSLDMENLAEMNQDDLISVLRALTDDYGAWIQEQVLRIGTDVHGYDDVATEAINNCQKILLRLNEGIDVLGSKTDTNALEAFRFANRAMASQRIHSIYALSKRRGENPDPKSIDVSKNRSWRPFQLAFILLSIPALANPVHHDRTDSVQAYADLLWFPTGGGKTEAYLGVAAFTMAIRRLHGDLGGFDARRGLAVIMRYTLRLLTLQQFQRASTLICAMELLRRKDPKVWGQEPFTLGLWVGMKVTPNTTEDSNDAIAKEREGRWGVTSTPAQLTSCPWCGAEIRPGRDIRVDRDIKRTFIYCGDKYGSCEFGPEKSKGLGLPVLVVDEEIYHHPPSMLIATVDKFAMMPWKGEVRTLFGKASSECMRHGLLWPEADCSGNHQKKGSLPSTVVHAISPIRPPDLIIQDEFHLISGPLGTMVGLYETAVDELCTWNLNGLAIKPKIIASTATVRKAMEQTNNVFLRKVAVFPPHGLDVEDNFFSIQRSVQNKPGRRYIGICSPGAARPAVLIRVYTALLTAAQSLFEHFGEVADPYMTVVGYFNSLRELGGMKRLAEDDVQTRCFRVRKSEIARPGLSQRKSLKVEELTSRINNKEIPKRLDQLETKFKDAWEKGETRAIDIVLATNMLSVGVDISRLGLMVVNGQPKNTAEYIQATSRVGRSFPGLIYTVLTWARPRDLSHYETFEHYHATFYKHVEAQSVTPFAPRALDRGLTGTMVSLLRLGNDLFNPNTGAEEMNSAAKPEAINAKQAIADRAWKVKNKTAKQLVEKMAADRIDLWVKEANKGGRRLGYEPVHRQGDLVGLLKKPGARAWDVFTVAMSMREVEPGVNLIMDERKLPDPPTWRAKEISTDKNGGTI